MNNLDKQYDTYLIDDFDKTLKLLHESTHDEKIREAILIVLDYKTNMNKFRTERPSMKRRLVLLNAEGNILTAVKENGEFKLIDEFKQHIATFNEKEMFKFTRGQITIYNSQEEEMNYMKYSGGMKPNLKELDEFIGVDTTGLSY